MSVALTSRLSAWLTRPHEHEPAPVRLTQRRIYILPSRSGLLLGMTLALMLLGCINYNLGLGYVLTFLLAGVAVVLHQRHWRRADTGRLVEVEYVDERGVAFTGGVELADPLDAEPLRELVPDRRSQPVACDHPHLVLAGGVLGHLPVDAGVAGRLWLTEQRAAAAQHGEGVLQLGHQLVHVAAAELGELDGDEPGIDDRAKHLPERPVDDRHQAAPDRQGDRDDDQLHPLGPPRLDEQRPVHAVASGTSW